MPRYVAFLRGVSSGNLKMPDLKRCLEIAGYTRVKTILSSGNVVFDSARGSVAAIERRIEAGSTKQLGRSFYTIVRSVEELNDLIEADRYAAFGIGCVRPGGDASEFRYLLQLNSAFRISD